MFILLALELVNRNTHHLCSHLGLRIVVREPRCSLEDSVWKGTCPRFDEGKGHGVAVCSSHDPPLPTTTAGVALKIQLACREGIARFAVGCQHQDPRGCPPPTIPPGTLTLKGAQPSHVHNVRGLGALECFLKSRLAETTESEAS